MVPGSMELKLLPEPYHPDSQGIYRKGEAQDFAYSDGEETERRLLEQVKAATDVSLGSDSLQACITDWASEYHFTPLRANLLSPFPLERFTKVLEIGCGLGAITRLLGERCGQVLALEGSYARALVAKERVRDLNKVQVVVENFNQLQTEERFDLITLIGVLEYAPGFFGGNDPIQEMLLKAKSLLAPGGVLVVAIENQLGLKYLNGCSEDHAAQPYFGVHGLYEGSPFVTFGRKEFAQVLAQAGFGPQQYYYPFPDYKLPQFMVPEGTGAEGPNLGKIAGEYIARDYTGSNNTHFIESRVWPLLAKNQLLPDLANSFLTFCSLEKESLTPLRPDWLAVSFSGRRQKAFLNWNRFVLQNGKLKVIKEALYPKEKPKAASMEQHFGVEDYLPGSSFSDQITQALLKQPQSEVFLSQLTKWIQALKAQADNQGNLPGSRVEFVPFNLKVTAQGELLPFDQEWAAPRPIPLNWVVFRGLLHLWQRFRLALPIYLFPLPYPTLRALLEAVDSHFQLRFSPERLEECMQLEQEFQSLVSGAKGDGAILRALLDAPLIAMEEPPSPQEPETKAQGFEAQSLRWRLLQEQAARKQLELRARQLEQAQQQLQIEKDEIQLNLEKHIEMIHGLWASWSWRIGRKVTWPARKLKTLWQQLKKQKKRLRPLKAWWIGLTQGKEAKALYVTHLLSGNYAAWHARHYQLHKTDQEKIRSHIQQFAKKPFISVILPTYNPPEVWLRKAIESVQNQLYPHWELCIADDASTDSTTKQILKEYAAKDKRIKVVFREQNGHISESSNSAIELAQGEYIALLDHDDELTEDALYGVAWAINERPGVKLIYSDEDKYTPQGFLDGFYFKPDYSPDLLYSHNYICHLGVYHLETLRQIGGFRKGYEGSQDWDLALRFIRAIDPKTEIYHLPRVLYHWRMIPGSTGLDISYKNYAIEAAKKAIADDIRARHPGRSFEVISLVDIPGNFRVRYLLAQKPKVSLIMLTRDGMHVLKTCVDSILAKTQYPNFELIIVDNGSAQAETLAYFEKIKQDARVRVLRYDIPFNFSKLNNLAVPAAEGKILGLINNDLEVLQGNWLEEMVSHAARPEIGCVGAKLLYPHGALQHGGVIVGLGGVAGHSHKGFPGSHPGHARRLQLIHNLSAVTAACLLIRKEVYLEVGQLDETNLKIAFNDVDFCLKVKQRGYWNLITPYAELIHHESATRGYEDNPEKVARFEKEKAYMANKWGPTLAIDPFYNPNFTLDREDFSLADQPRMPKPWLNP